MIDYNNYNSIGVSMLQALTLNKTEFEKDVFTSKYVCLMCKI